MLLSYERKVGPASQQNMLVSFTLKEPLRTRIVFMSLTSIHNFPQSSHPCRPVPRAGPSLMVHGQAPCQGAGDAYRVHICLF